MAFGSGISPDVVRTLLDDVWDQTFSGEESPNFATALDEMLFVQSTTDRAAEVMEMFKGVGEWESTEEEEDLPQGNPRVGNQKIFNVANWKKQINIPIEFFEDDQHDSYEKMVRNFARRAQTTRDKTAFAAYRNAFTTELTADGLSWINDSHINMSGRTISNKLTTALSETSLNDAINLLLEMRSQDDEQDGFTPYCLLVPNRLFKTAYEILDAELQSFTTDNNPNIYSAKYGIYLKQTFRIGASAGGSDTAWFLLSKDHSNMRFVRKAVETSLVDYKLSDNDVYKYKGRYREAYGALSYEGVVASTGLT